MRKLDYLEKGLSIEDRQKLFSYLKTDISETMMKYYLEKEIGYPSFHSCGFTDENIRLIWDDTFYEIICKINHIMTRNDRSPLFAHPSDSYKSATDYFDLMQIREEKELLEIFGCSFQEYHPDGESCM